MAIINHCTAACLKNLAGNSRNKQLSFVLRSFHKSAASDILGISEERAMTPPDVVEETRIKTLKEMPGPSTFANLIEFFWRDGFSRIHEIQVTVASCASAGDVLVMFDWLDHFCVFSRFTTSVCSNGTKSLVSDLFSSLVYEFCNQLSPTLENYFSLLCKKLHMINIFLSLKIKSLKLKSVKTEKKPDLGANKTRFSTWED